MAQLNRWYLHVDLDAFFASVEQLDNPEYRGKPVIVGGKPEDRRSVVSTASYEARKYGVHSAMPTFQAYKLCPNGIFVHGRMDRYSELSYQIMNIFRNYSPDVDQMSIDEAFIDITGTEKLFGPPLEIAKKIKAEVKSKTGLTVSIGIAPTKYLAKIASGFQKPDGITFINQGEEESFMLSLPLNKVWGLGPKSLELLRSKGIKTTRDIYETPLENLTFMFGNNMGNYLYEVVRGNEKATFKREAKNHSISSESTYPYDLTAVYAIETELLELCHGVFFRLLKEGAYSRTAFVKIRYEDFSTCTVQETLDRNIITLDTYFETVKRLFEKKYEKGRGIRLLGVGFENVDTEDKPYQQDLFGNKDEKKQAVEKAILNLEKKHPEIKVRKARTFKSIILFTLLSIFSTKVEAQSGAGTLLPDSLYEPNVTEESHFTYTDERDNHLFEYEIEGYYQSEFLTGITTSFGGNQNFDFAGIPPVFKQEVELSASVLYNNHWYFQADFADKFETNTITIGYKDGLYLRDAKISNRNIIFPSGYSAEIFGYSPKGGKNQSPGFSINFASPSNKWMADFLLRYDMAESHSATFYGLNKVTDTYISPANFVYGNTFTFPSQSKEYLSNIKNIYIEDTQGTYKDTKGKKYKKLSLTQYTVLLEKNTVLIAANAGGNKKDDYIPTIIVTFNSPDAVENLITLTGDYSDKDSFAGKQQSELGLNLSNYSYNLRTKIDNETALVIQNSTGFSPYLNKTIYDCGLTSDTDLLLVSADKETILKQYKITILDDWYNSIYEDFFQENHTYATIINLDYPDLTYPLSKVDSNIYTGKDNDYSVKILSRSYTPSKELSIGTKAASGSVQVYRNGVLEADANYNSETGTVTLKSPVTNTDKIYITWQEDSQNFNNGVFVTAAGYKINFTENFKADISLSGYLPVNSIINNNILSTPETLQTSYLALAGGVSYENENFHISNKTTVALTKENAANKLLVCSQENELPSTSYLDINSGYETKTEPYIVTSNFSQQLLQQYNCTLNNHMGIKDSFISGYAIPLSWDFSKGQFPWSSVDIKLSSANSLNNASLFELAIKSNIPADEFANYDFFLQLGINASNEFSGEDTELIPCWRLSPENTEDWQTLRIQINETQRSYLNSYHDARIIVLPKNSNINTSGTIYIGPYEVYSQSIFTKAPDDVFVSSLTGTYLSDYYSSIINWYIPQSANISTLDDSYIYAKKYFTPADFHSYESINLDFATVNVSSFNLQLSSNNSSAIQITINNIESYYNKAVSMHTLSINVENNNVYIDNVKLNNEDYELQINKNLIPSSFELQIPLTPEGSFTIGNLCYENTKLTGIAKNYSSVEYKKDFQVVSIKASANSLQSSGSFLQPEYSIVSNGKAELLSKYGDLKYDLSISNTELSSAGHNIRGSLPFYNLLTVTEDYRYSKSDNSLSKKDSLSLDFTKVSVPVKFNFNTYAQSLPTIQSQITDFEALSNIKINEYSTNISLKTAYSQKLNTVIYSEYELKPAEYFSSWKDISIQEFSLGNKDSHIRQSEYNFELSQTIPYAELSPSISAALLGQYKNSNTIYFSDRETLALNVPFKIQDNSLVFNISRTANGVSEFYSGTDYKADNAELFNIQNDRKWFYTSIPFYELFSQDLQNEVTSAYSAKYETTYKRKLFNSFKDIYIPSAASFAVIRDIKSIESSKDLYQYKIVVTNTSINNFGSNSMYHLFDWFKQEEAIGSITGILKVPADSPETSTYQITAYLQSLFYIDNNSTLQAALDGSFETNLNWSTHGTLVYKRPSNNSFVLNLAQFIVPSLKKIDFNIIRKDLLNIQISTTNNINKQIYSYSHELEHNFLTYFSFNTGLGGKFTYLQNSAFNLELQIKLGIKVEF